MLVTIHTNILQTLDHRKTKGKIISGCAALACLQTFNPNIQSVILHVSG